MQKKKNFGIIKGLGFIIIYLLIFLINSKLVSMFFAYTAVSGIKGIVDTLKYNFFLELILSTGIPFLCYVLIMKIRKEKFWKYCKFKLMNLNQLFACIFIGISISIFILCFIQVPGLGQMLYGVKNFFASFDNGNILATVFFVFIIYTVFEEVLFRGLIFNELRKIFPFVIAVIGQALLCVFLQSDVMMIVFGVASYIIYSLAYAWADSIWASIILLYTSHLFILLMRKVGFVVWLSQVDIIFPIAGIGLSMVITAILLYMLWKNQKKAAALA